MLVVMYLKFYNQHVFLLFLRVYHAKTTNLSLNTSLLSLVTTVPTMPTFIPDVFHLQPVHPCRHNPTESLKRHR